jgi:hypothetical protein
VNSSDTRRNGANSGSDCAPGSVEAVLVPETTSELPLPFGFGKKATRPASGYSVVAWRRR